MNGGMVDLNRYMKNGTQAALINALWEGEQPAQGYGLAASVAKENGWPYAAVKGALQQLRNDGVLIVTKMGPAGKAKWIAYQQLWFAPAYEVQLDAMQTEDHDLMARRIRDARALVGGGRKISLGVNFIDDRERMAVLRAGVAARVLRVVVLVGEDF